MIKTQHRGFTLIELLVVISIIAVLSASAAVMAPKILKKGAQTKSVNSMRQMMSSFQLYANDHANRLPPPVTPAEESPAKKDTYWFTQLEYLTSGKELEQMLKDSYWKDAKNSIFINPMHPKRDVKASATGYAMNGVLAYNIAVNREEKMDPEDSVYTAVNLVTLKNAERIPIVMPHWTWHYTCDNREAADKRFEPYLAGSRLPVLFIDGHVETMTPREYARRGLNKLPKPAVRNFVD